MNSILFNALEVSQYDEGCFVSNIVEKEIQKLKEGHVLIQVEYSSLNYKDALSAKGNKGVTRKFPHVPGIDAAGIVEASSVPQWTKGDKVIVTGFDLGMNTDGGFEKYIEVPANWIIRLPDQLSMKEAMIYGTAGLTAGLSVNALLVNGIQSSDGLVAVSGATGGVGSIAVSILSKLGFKVAAISGKESSTDFLKVLGASEIILRQTFKDNTNKPLLQSRYAAAIDTVGGDILATLIKSLQYEGIVTTCGMVGGTALNTTVFPFILKGIQLIGIDSVEISLDKRIPIWGKLANDWKPKNLDQLAQEISLTDLPSYIDKIYNGQMQGRIVVRL